MKIRNMMTEVEKAAKVAEMKWFNFLISLLLSLTSNGNQNNGSEAEKEIEA